MDTENLVTAYRDLVAAARAVAAGGAADAEQRAETDWTLAHIALSDLVLVDVARRLSAGGPARVDNSSAMDPEAISTLISQTGFQERVDLVAARGAELIDRIKAQPDELGAASLEVHLVDREGRTAFEGELTWGEIVRARGAAQISGHAARLLGYAQGTP